MTENQDADPDSTGDQDVCTPLQVDGETVRVRGTGQLTKEGEEALTALVRVAKAKLVADAPDQVGVLQNRLRLAHKARRAKEHLLDDIRRALCDAELMQDDDPYSHADLADVIRQAGDEPRRLRERLRLLTDEKVAYVTGPTIELLCEENNRLKAEVAAARGFAGEMREFCSPHGVAADYADRLIETMDRAKEGPAALAGLREQKERPTHPDGTPYGYADMVAEGWEFCDGCRMWTTATVQEPHSCAETYIHGPSAALGDGEAGR